MGCTYSLFLQSRGFDTRPSLCTPRLTAAFETLAFAGERGTRSAQALKSCCSGWTLVRAGRLSDHVALAQLLGPFRVVAKRPVFAYPAAGDRAERVSSAGMDQGEVEVAEQEEEGDVHQPVVHDQRVLEAERVVALAVPEEEAGDGEENGERGGDGRVDLLTSVEAALRCAPAFEPGEVVAVEPVDLPRGCDQAAAV